MTRHFILSFCLKTLLYCSSFIYKLNRLSDARLMKNIVKKHVNGPVSSISNSYNILERYSLHSNTRINSLKFETVIQNFCQNGFDEDHFVPDIPCSNSFLHLPNYTFFS